MEGIKNQGVEKLPQVENKIDVRAKLVGQQVRKVAVEYVKLCGYKQGRPQKESNMDCLSLDEIASQLGTSKTNLKRALTIERNLTESIKQLLDDGIISKTDQQRK